MSYQPLTGQPCTCKRGQARDNCPQCEGTGMQIDFAAIRKGSEKYQNTPWLIGWRAGVDFKQGDWQHNPHISTSPEGIEWQLGYDCGVYDHLQGVVPRKQEAKPL